MDFTVGDERKCHNYTINDDNICELGAMETIFKIRLALIETDDPGLEVNLSRAVTTVSIDDRREPECCKPLTLLYLSIINNLYITVLVIIIQKVATCYKHNFAAPLKEFCHYNEHYF